MGQHGPFCMCPEDAKGKRTSERDIAAEMAAVKDPAVATLVAYTPSGDVLIQMTPLNGATVKTEPCTAHPKTGEPIPTNDGTVALELDGHHAIALGRQLIETGEKALLLQATSNPIGTLLGMLFGSGPRG